MNLGSEAMSSIKDSIEILLPLKAEYVSVARLAVSGVASRMGFDIDTIEDIKVATAEVCNKLVNRGSTSAPCYKIVLGISEDKLDITFECEDKALGCIFSEDNDELGISLINALMDDVDSCAGSYVIRMSKAVERDI